MSHRILTAVGRLASLLSAWACIGMVRSARADETMSYREMASMMEMDDTARFGKVMLDQLEWRNGDGGESRAAWDAQAWYGGDYDKFWVKTEGDYVGSDPDKGLHEASVDALWNRVFSRWWSVESGVRRDFGSGASGTWAALGIQGLAPQWFQTEATFYASDGGRTAMRLKVSYDLLLTQRLVLQPYAEANLYGRADPQQRVGSGLSDLELSMRLRYELRRELAPYLGLVWLHRFGGTADFARTDGVHGAGEAELAAGLRAWF
jgi:copper resistance protein B